MIKSLYCGQVKATTRGGELMTVFQMANRFEVRPCLDICSKMMQELTMTLEISAQILDACKLSQEQQSEEVKKLLSLASSFLCSHFQWTHSSAWDSAKVREWQTLSPHALRILLGSDGLIIPYEEKAFQMLEMWISANCKKCDDGDNEKDRAVCEFGQLIRWPLMEWFCLQQYLKKFESKEGDQHPLRTLIIEALLYRASRFVNTAQKALGSLRFRNRVHCPLPVTFIRMNHPYDHGLVFFSVTVSELDRLPPEECRYSERFSIGSIGMQWKLKRCGLLSGNPILASLDYFGVLSTEVKQARPSVSLSLWQTYQYLETETKNGWFATKSNSSLGNICSFRAELKVYM